MKTLEFKKLTVFDSELIKKYAALRPIYTSEGQFMNQFIWENFYDTYYHVNEKFLFFRMKINGEYATMMPYCKVEDAKEAFFEIKRYFNEELKQPLKLYIADQLFVDCLKEDEQFQSEFDVAEDRNCFDYIYDAQKLKTLSGKAYHKKKNHLNNFLKQYGDRYEFRTLCCSNQDEILEFHKRWLDHKEDVERQDAMDSEEEGILKIFQNCAFLDCKMGGIYIDGTLEAYTIGSYNEALSCAFIHIEKANTSINGLYNIINQQFLIHCFPDALIVNREDDLGQEGLRKAKLSYRPIRLEEKFNIFEKTAVAATSLKQSTATE